MLKNLALEATSRFSYESNKNSLRIYAWRLFAYFFRIQQETLQNLALEALGCYSYMNLAIAPQESVPTDAWLISFNSLRLSATALLASAVGVTGGYPWLSC